MVYDSRGLAIQAHAQGNVIINTLAGECAQQDDEREHRNQQTRAEQHGLAGKVELLQLPDEALRQRSFEPVPRRRRHFAARRTRWRRFPPSGGLTILTVGLQPRCPLPTSDHRASQ